jgi:flagellar basal-body rod modification protein FlgD
MSTPITSANSSGSATSAAQQQATPVLPTQTLNQQDFLNLLVAQMQAQDPLNPVSNTDFIAQMAQFSNLQVSQGIESGVTSLQSQQQFTQANSLLGANVSLLTSSGAIAQGAVSSIQMQAGTPQIVVNGQAYSLSQVVSVSP